MRVPPKASAAAGLTLIELLVVIAIGLIVAAIAVPQVMNSYQVYKLNQAATNVAGVLKYTKFEAVRENASQLNFCTAVAPGGAGNLVYTQSACTGGGGQYQALVLPNVVLNPTGPPAGLAAASGATGGLTMIPASGGSLAFTSRGGLPANLANAYVLYFNNTSAPGAGYRAVVVMPSGAIHTWSAAGTGGWQQMN